MRKLVTLAADELELVMVMHTRGLLGPSGLAKAILTVMPLPENATISGYGLACATGAGGEPANPASMSPPPSMPPPPPPKRSSMALMALSDAAGAGAAGGEAAPN